MPIIKRRLDICGRERVWEYSIESGGERYEVSARQVGRGDPSFHCSCGSSYDPEDDSTGGGLFFTDSFMQPCCHILESQRDLNLARQAAAQMIP